MIALKRAFAIILSVTFLVLGTGCGSNYTGRKPDRIVMWLVGSEAQARFIMQLGEEFKKKTGVGVLCQAISWGDAHSKYLTSIAGEVTPDIGTMGLTWGMEFGELGAMVDLRGEFPQDMEVMEKKIFPSLLESTRYGNKVFGFPFDISEHIMYYRTDIIPTPPESWVELMDLIKKLKVQNKGALIDWGGLDWIGYSPFLWQAGGNYYNGDYTKATLNTQEAAEALTFFAELYKEGVPKTKVPLEQGMRTGDYPIAISGNWKIISLSLSAPEIKNKWSIALLPAGPAGKRTAFIGGRVFGIFTKSKMKKESWEFIKFLFEPENQLRLYQESLDTEDAYLPPNMEAWKTLPMEAKFKKVLQAQARDAKGTPPVLAWDASTRFINYAVQMVVLKNSDPASELSKANKEMQKELEDYRK